MPHSSLAREALPTLATLAVDTSNPTHVGEDISLSPSSTLPVDSSSSDKEPEKWHAGGHAIHRSPSSQLDSPQTTLRDSSTCATVEFDAQIPTLPTLTILWGHIGFVLFSSFLQARSETTSTRAALSLFLATTDAVCLYASPRSRTRCLTPS